MSSKRRSPEAEALLMEATLATLTPKQKQALAIVRANPGIRPQRFAKLMWPNSECWEKRYRCGNGTHKGGGMHTAGGAYLGKLRKLRLVHLEGEWGHEGYYVSRKR